MDARFANISRRGFLKGAAATGLVVGVQLPARRSFAQTAEGISPADLAKWEESIRGKGFTPSAFVAIDESGKVTIACARVEMGQGIRSTLPAVVADEMEADWARCQVVQAPGDEKVYGRQDTDGSRSLRHFLLPMREVGAMTRMMLEMAAARQWGVPVTDVRASNHQVMHMATRRTLGYGELAKTAAEMPVPARKRIQLKDPSKFRFIGKEMPKPDVVAMTSGTAVYGQDVIVPGMKIAVIARPPVYGGKVVSVDDSAAKAVPGVERIVRIPETPIPSAFKQVGGVAVIAGNTWAAIQGRDKLKITWDDGPNKVYDSKTYRSQLEETARKPGKVVRQEGDVDRAMKSAAKVVKAEYYAPHIIHATMEPLAAAVKFEGGQAEVWACTQMPESVKNEVAGVFGIPADKVKVNVTFLGGGFGRKSKCDFVVEAAYLAKELGEPVKVVWTREDDLQHGYYHSVAAQHLEAGLDSKGKPVAWLHRSVFPSIFSTFEAGFNYGHKIELGMGLVDVPYQIPNIRCENGEAQAHVRIGWFRSVANIYHGFAVNSFANELAVAAGRDPKDYLLELIGQPRKVDPRKGGADWWNYDDPVEIYPLDTARLRRVVEVAADKAGWGRKLAPGHGLGIAVQRTFLTYVATVVEVAVDKEGNLEIPRVDTAIDAGTIANPDRIRSQVEGAAVMALSLAKYGEISFKDGRVEQTNFNNYPMVRINEAPRETHVHIIQSNAYPSGVGEPGVPPFAPALCNAIFAATGKRIRALPIRDQLA